MSRMGTTIRVLFLSYQKPDDAYTYILFISSHRRQVFQGWVLVELLSFSGF